MLNTPNGATLGSTVVVYGSYAWTATKAWTNVLSESGERKDEIAKRDKATPFARGRLTWESLVWRIALGLHVANKSRQSYLTFA